MMVVIRKGRGASKLAGSCQLVRAVRKGQVRTDLVCVPDPCKLSFCRDHRSHYEVKIRSKGQHCYVIHFGGTE